jgi:hypothetical protein
MPQIRRTTTDPATTDPLVQRPTDPAYQTDEDLIGRENREGMVEDRDEGSVDRGDYDSRVGETETPVRHASTRAQTLNAANQPDWNVNTATADQRAGNSLDYAETPLFSDSEVGDFRNRWSNVQAGFVDEPRRAVQEADNLVGAVMQKLADGFANERSTLESQWDSGSSVSTEELRIALQRYRSFFGRLLNAA